ncbi:MAG: hypothetical protein PF505_05640, partial [Vallitaleaceae bacterium]|nr:hypothetical protein [Vallitaleaceae bacterium]
CLTILIVDHTDGKRGRGDGPGKALNGGLGFGAVFGRGKGPNLPWSLRCRSRFFLFVRKKSALL